MSGENYINHVALVLDASYSMTPHKSTIIKVADEQTRYLAQRSAELDQETRITVYSFDDHARCLVYDKDVLRLPSMADLYRIGRNTALIDATLLSIEDLKMQPTKYGDHSFLAYVLTDGFENQSRNTPSALQRKLASLEDHWTIAALVPNAEGERWCKRIGFTPGNIAIWDTSSAAGLEESFGKIRTATENFMLGRQQGVRGTRSLFSTGPDAINRQTVQANLVPLSYDRYQVVPVVKNAEIREWVEGCGYHYRTGEWFYELTKPEDIQPQKKLAVMDKGGNVFVGENVRTMVGLPDYKIRVRPDFNPDYKVFVQSTSVNRKLLPGTKLLRMTQ
jgi:hypothetical protein